MLHATKFIISDHFEAILDELASISIKRHQAHILHDFVDQEFSMTSFAILKYRTENKSAILIRYHFVIASQNFFNKRRNRLLLAILNHSLNDSTAILMDAILNHLFFYFCDEFRIEVTVLKSFDNDDYLLNNMVSIEVK